jgi:hypothetical protein
MQAKKTALTKKIIKPRNVRELRDSLDPRQRAFVREMVRNGGYGPGAAMRAGYPDPKRAATELTRNLSIGLAIRSEQMAFVGMELSSCALRTIHRIMRDESFRASDRLNAARLAMEAAKMIGRAAAADAPREKPIAEMSTAELDAMLAETQAALSQLTAERRTIEHVTPDTASDAQSADVPVLQAQVEPAK